MKSLVDLLNDKQKPKEFKSWDKPVDNHKILDENQELEQQKQQQQAIFDKAYQEGLHKAQAEINRQQKRLVDLLELLQKPLMLIDEQLEQELLNTLLWFCKECVQIEIEQRPEKLLSVVQQIKQHLPMMQGTAKILLSSEDIDDLRHLLTTDDDLNLMNAFLEDESLSRGEFRLISDSSEIDGRFDARLSAMLQDA